ncbi:hypothetical protein Tco_0898402 [Tanacetum coccineum]
MPAQSQTSSVPEQQYQLYLAMKADPQLQQQDIAIWLAIQMKFERNTVLQTACRTPAVRPRDQSHHRVTSIQEEQAPLTSGNQEQNDDFDFWTDSYASDDDEIPSKQVSQEIIEEVSLTIDEAKLRKMADEMLRQRCTSGNEHQYHIDQIKNFLKSDIVWKSRKEIIVSSHPQKATLLVQSCQRDPEAPALSLINQDLMYPDYKNLNKNDIEDIYLLIMNGNVPDYANIGLLWSLLVFIRSAVIWERVHGFQLGIKSLSNRRLISLSTNNDYS